MTNEAAFSPPATELLTVVTRSGEVESYHRGALVVVENDQIIASVGDPQQMVFARSSTKAMQALPLLESGMATKLGLGDRELAMLSASHEGTPAHVEVAAQLLARGDFGESQLGCGPHAPYDRKSSYALAGAGQRPNRLHNNCSGKHAGFLLLTRHTGDDPANYLDPSCKTQQLIAASVQEMCDVDASSVHVGIDGCGAPTFCMPLVNLAKGFARLANPAPLGNVRTEACQRLLAAIHQEPLYLAGEGRLCTELVRSLPQGIYPKNGAEGVYAFGLAGRNIGVAIKVADGHERGYLPVVVELLRRLEAWPEVPERLQRFARVPVWNTLKQQVGEVTCVLPDFLGPHSTR